MFYIATFVFLVDFLSIFYLLKNYNKKITIKIFFSQKNYISEQQFNVSIILHD